MTQIFTKTAGISLALAAMTVFSGCATTISPEARLAYDQTQKSLKSQPVSIISDGCVLKIELGKNDILYQQSDLTSLAMMATVEEALDDKGLKISQTTAPFVCGTLPKDRLTKMDILTTPDAKEVLNTAYPILSSTNTLDSATNQAYLSLFQALDQDKRKMASAANGKNVDLGLDKQTLQALQIQEKTDKVFVSIVMGARPSFGYSMAIGITSAVAAGGTSFLAPQQEQTHSLYLINLKTNKIELGKSNAFMGKMFKMPVDERFAYKELLSPLYEDK